MKPEDFDMSPLVTAATSAHEMYSAFKEAGFSDDQAMSIVIAVLTGALKKDG